MWNRIKEVRRMAANPLILWRALGTKYQHARPVGPWDLYQKGMVQGMAFAVKT